MFALRLRKEWKKKWKRWRRPVWLLGATAAPWLLTTVLLTALAGAGYAPGPGNAPGAGAAERGTGNRPPAARETDYLVVDERGMLTLTDDPRLIDNAVRTFFQLSIRALEISLPERRGNRLA